MACGSHCLTLGRAAIADGSEPLSGSAFVLYMHFCAVVISPQSRQTAFTFAEGVGFGSREWMAPSVKATSAWLPDGKIETVTAAVGRGQIATPGSAEEILRLFGSAG